MRALALGLALLAAGCGGAEMPERLGPAALADRLRGGGYVIFLRHALTDRSQQDLLTDDLGDCSRQRNLNDAGREQARELGRQLRRLEIPVGEVLSSAYCRTRETAELAFGRFRVEDGLTGIPADAREPQHEQRVRVLRRLLATPTAEGTNVVLVGHIANLEAATELEIEEGDVAVFVPLGDTFRLAGVVPSAVWPQLAGK